MGWSKFVGKQTVTEEAMQNLSCSFSNDLTFGVRKGARLLNSSNLGRLSKYYLAKPLLLRHSMPVLKPSHITLFVVTSAFPQICDPRTSSASDIRLPVSRSSLACLSPGRPAGRAHRHCTVFHLRSHPTVSPICARSAPAKHGIWL